MNRRVPRLAIWAAAVLIAVVVAPWVSGPSLSSPSNALGAAATIVDKIRQRGVVVVGMEASFPPYEYIVSGKIVGFDVDLARWLGKALGVRVQLIDVPMSGAIPGLLVGKYDVLISGITITPERAKRVAFSIPYGEATASFLVLAKGPYETAKDLVGKKIAVQLGGAGETQALAWTEELTKKYGEGFGEVLRFQTQPDTHLAVDAGRADAAIDSLPSLSLLVAKFPGKYRVIPGLGKRAYFGIAVRKQDGALKQFIDGQIRALKANGQLSALQKKWLGFASDIPNELPEFAK